MSTLSDLRSALRTLLNDNVVGSYLWEDSALNLHLNDALRSYGRSFPLERETTISTVAGQAAYDLPSECMTVVRVAAPESAPDVMVEGGDAAGTGYELFGGKLSLLPAPTEDGQSITVRYLAPHAPLALDTDVSTVPAFDEDLILAFAAVRALQSLAVEEAKRQLFEQRAGQSAEAAIALYWEQYVSGVMGRGAGIRVGRLMAT